MLITFEYIAFFLEEIFSQSHFIDRQFSTIAIRIQCELYLINSIGFTTSSEYKFFTQSHLIIIDRDLNKSQYVIPIKFNIELPIEETINYSSFCNYTYLCLFKIIDENSFCPEKSILGYSLLPLLDVEGYARSNTLKMPIILNYSQIVQNRVSEINDKEIYQFMFSNKNKLDVLQHYSNIANILIGFMCITLKFNQLTYSCFKKNYKITSKLRKEHQNNTDLKTLLNLIYDKSSFFKFQECIQRYNQISLCKIKISDQSPLFLRDSDILHEKDKKIMNHKIELEIESKIKKLYLSYLTRFNNKDFLKEEIDFIWKHRYLIVNFESGLPLLIHYANLKDDSVVKEIRHVIGINNKILFETVNNGKKKILTIGDSLNLLSRDYREFEFIRQFAIDNLIFCTKQELKLILPQLVQSLRYEKGTEVSDFLKKKVINDFELCIELFWLLISETSNPGYLEVFEREIFNIIDELTNFNKTNICSNYNQELYCCLYHQNLEIIDVLLSQIQFRATLLWIHRVSVEECKRERLEKKLQKFQSILYEIESGNMTNSSLRIHSSSVGINKTTIKLLISLKYMIENENELTKDCKKTTFDKNLHSSKIIWKDEYLCLNNSTYIENIGLPIMDITNLVDPLPLPMDTNKALIGVVPNESFIIKSSLCPFILSCRMAIIHDSLKKEKRKESEINCEQTSISESIYPVVESKYMYKVGDDLRQDRLVIQLLEISYKILEEWNIKNIVSTYKVLPFSQSDGLIGFLEGFSSIGSIRKKYGKNCILQFWATAHNTTISNIPQNVMNTFILSCAAYSVITFILGVGDRHLDNLLVGKTGHFLHVDFGYIFGEDPKPFPPPMKICTEMVEAMGGLNSYGFRLFVDKCCEFYRYIRRKSWFIFNLLILMIDSGIKDLNSRSENEYISTLEKIKEKFRLELNEVSAEDYLREIIMTSSKALFPAVVDTLHDWALYWT